MLALECCVSFPAKLAKLFNLVAFNFVAFMRNMTKVSVKK